MMRMVAGGWPVIGTGVAAGCGALGVSCAIVGSVAATNVSRKRQMERIRWTRMVVLRMAHGGG
jgi:F0F1-type ATP synthase membrane subunit c/vacuolar-type H+-ATPase subunit K